MRLRLWALFGVAGLLAAAAGRAADPQPYRLSFTATGSGALDATLKATSELQSLRTTAPVSPFGLIARARGDVSRLQIVLHSYGYYQGSVNVTIDGNALGSSELADQLSALPKGKDARVVLAFVLGKQYHLRNVTLDGTMPAALRATLGLKSGQPAVAADVLAGGARLLTALQDRGYAFAKVDPPVAYELPDTQQMDVSFHVVTGKVVQIGTIEIQGLKRMSAVTARAQLELHTGEQYSAVKVERARRNLLAMGVFSAVDTALGTHADSSGRVPVTFKVSERRRHAVSLNAAYSSDLGASGGVSWSDRDLFGHGEQLNLSASLINLDGSATNGVGYDTGAQLIIPQFSHHGQSLELSLTAIQQSLQAYDQTAETAGITLNRVLSSTWSASAGLSTTQETIHQPEELLLLGRDTFYYTLFALPLTLRYDSTDLTSPLTDATHGMRASLSVTPTLSLGPPDATFIISQLRASTYLDLHGLIGTSPGRTVLALRAVSGYAEGAASYLDLPPDQRFYAGGSGTIRGYRFESVGPRFSDGTPVGGLAVDAGTVELRQRVGQDYGFAVFLDGGRVGENAEPFTGQFHLGAGAGVRYYTPIGPLRLDLAVPVPQRSSNFDRFEVYIGLGQAF